MKYKMTSEEIKHKYNTIQKKLEKWYLKEKELQTICPHTNSTKKYESNTGNYDPSADSYWIRYHCPDCNKHWQTDQ